MVKIITDTTSCLSPAAAKKYGIPIIPQVIHFGNETFLEGIDIDIATFMRKLVTSPELPKTAAPPPDLFIQEFKKLVPTGESIICIHPSIEVSGTVRSAQVAAAEFPEADIRVIDTRLIASPLGTLVEQAAQWADAGEDPDAIEIKVVEMAKRCRIYFMVASLDYLARGGRIGGAAALLGSLLQIKPILTLVNGRVEQCEKERTHKHALARMREMVTRQIAKKGPGFLSILHGGVPALGQALADDLGASLGIEAVPVFDMPPAIVTHGGPGVLGTGFFTD
jgi:DegV family protein with EDD domain